MLIFAVGIGERVLIGDDVVITRLSNSSQNMMRIGIEAPRHIPVDREKVRRAKELQAHPPTELDLDCDADE
jgi:carbon storage regulator